MEFLFPVILLVAAVGLPLLLGVGLVLVLSRRGEFDFSINLRGTYFYLVSFATLWIAFFGFARVTDSILELTLQTYYVPQTVDIVPPAPVPESSSTPTPQPSGPPRPQPTPPPPDRYTREQIAEAGAILLIAVPVWIFHWRRAQALAIASQGHFSHRVYLYGVMIIGLVAALVTGGMLLSQFLEYLLGTVDWAVDRAVRNFWKETLSSGLNLVAAVAIWVYHWRLVETLPKEDS